MNFLISKGREAVSRLDTRPVEIAGPTPASFASRKEIVDFSIQSEFHDKFFFFCQIFPHCVFLYIVEIITNIIRSKNDVSMGSSVEKAKR